MARNSQHCSEFLEKIFKNECLHCVPAMAAKEQSHLTEVQLAQGNKELNCSKPQQASAFHTKVWSAASSLGLVFKLI